MADQSGYQDLVKLIEQVEGSYKKKELDFVDVSETFPKGPSLQAKSYKDAVSEIEKIELGKKPQKEAAEKKEPTVESHLITAGLTQAQYAQPKVMPQPMKKTQAPVSAESLHKQRALVAKELGTLAERLGSIKPTFEELRRKRINLKDLVLPNLSLADQISELERVIEGLRESVFDANHITVLSQEVFGLQQAVNAAKRSQKTKLNSLEQSLWDLRDQRLADAIVLLKQHGAS
jgi:hypothetical protein